MRAATKAVLGVVAIAIPAVFNFLSARAESNEAKIRAEVAYTTMVEQVKDLQETVHDMELDHAEMQGKIYELERVQAARTGSAAPKPPRADGDGIPDKRLKQMNAPLDFEDAVRSYKAKK